MISLNCFPESTDISKVWIAYKKNGVQSAHRWHYSPSRYSLLHWEEEFICKVFYLGWVLQSNSVLTSDGAYLVASLFKLMTSCVRPSNSVLIFDECIRWHLDSNPWPHVTLRPLAHLNQEHLFDQLFTVSQSILEDDLPAAVTPDDDVIKLPEVELEKFISNVRTLVGIFRLATCPVWWFVVTELYFIPTLTTYFRK